MAKANVVVVSGNMTADPEMKQVGDKLLAKFQIAWQESRQNPDTGEWEKNTHFFQVEAWDGQARVAQKFNKGRHCTVYGRLRWRKWQAADGSNREATSITAESIVGDAMFDRLDDSAGIPAQAAPRRPRPVTNDDDIPFGNDARETRIPVGQAIEQELARRAPAPAAVDDIDDDIPW